MLKRLADRLRDKQLLASYTAGEEADAEEDVQLNDELAELDGPALLRVRAIAGEDRAMKLAKTVGEIRGQDRGQDRGYDRGPVHHPGGAGLAVGRVGAGHGPRAVRRRSEDAHADR